MPKRNLLSSMTQQERPTRQCMGLLFMQPDLATSGKLHCFFKERRAGKAVVSIVFN